jgi:hypothetical protein
MFVMTSVSGIQVRPRGRFQRDLPSAFIRRVQHHFGNTLRDSPQHRVVVMIPDLTSIIF